MPNRAAVARLLCLPFAGAGAAAYREWSRGLPDLDVHAAQLPGRAWRLRETPGTNLGALSEQVAEAFAPLADRPVVIFGHSMGAWMALLVARRLEGWGLGPRVVFASARQGPSLGCTQPPLHHLHDDEFVRQLTASYGGIPQEVLENPELLSLLLPAVRADVEALETYIHDPAPRVSCPIVAVGGKHDPMVPVANLFSWKEETTGDFEVQTFSGGHFYFQEDPAPLFTSLSKWAGEPNEMSALRMVAP